MYKKLGLTGVVLGGLVLVTPALAEQKKAVVTYDSAACQISSEWCVGSVKPKPKPKPIVRTDYKENELLLLYDSNKPANNAEDVMKRYRLVQKRSDNLGSIKTTMVTVATSGQNPLDLVEQINKSEKDINAHPSNLFFTAAQVGQSSQNVGYPLALTGIEAAHKLTKGEGVKIGLIDTPIDIAHRSLSTNQIRRMDLVSAGNRANQKHGTEMAGVLVSPNPKIGIAPGATLLAVSAFSVDPKKPSGHSSTAGLIAKAVDMCINEKVDVLNLSFAGSDDALVDKMIRKAVESGIVVVASAGNGGPSAKPAYPAALDNVVAVTAVDKEESLFGKANRGAYIDLAAPGVEILTTSPGGAFSVVSGTSLATAHVTGVVALLLSLKKKGQGSLDSVLLEQTAIDLGQRGRDNEYGYGLVNIARALSSAKVGN